MMGVVDRAPFLEMEEEDSGVGSELVKVSQSQKGREVAG